MERKKPGRKPKVKIEPPNTADNALQLRWLHVGSLVDRPGLVSIPGTKRHVVLQVMENGIWTDVPVEFE